MPAVAHVRCPVPASAEAVWDVVGDPGAIDRWIPNVVTCRFDGEVRRCELASGGTAVERVVARRPERREYEYEYEDGPLRMRSYRSRVRVEPADGGCVVDWRAELEAEDPADTPALAQRIEASYRAGIAGLVELTRAEDGHITTDC